LCCIPRKGNAFVSKYAKTGYGIQTNTIRLCSPLQEKELVQFPNAKALMLSGDVAIKALKNTTQLLGKARVILRCSTQQLHIEDALAD
jgi:uracil-DNA glycosylase